MNVDQHNREKFIIIVAGATAVGKTQLSFDLAEEYGAEIFSADSRQVYREMTIGTAKPTTVELERVQHHFINNRSIEEGYNVGDYYRELSASLVKYFETHNVAILTGGTGMYIHAAINGLNDYPTVADEIIEDLEATLAVGGIEILQQELHQTDPEYYAQVDIKNPMRLIRALSVIHETGETFSSFRQKITKGLPYTMLPVILQRDREELYERINHRVHLMLRSGLVQEVRSLIPHRELRALKTVGYQEMMRHVTGDIDIVAAVELIQRNSRRYAKRQMTWFRKYDWEVFHPEESEKIIKYLHSQIKNT